MTEEEIVILGGGLAGLSAAYHGGGVVFEGHDDIGGNCASPVVKGYVLDLGIHVLHTQNQDILTLLQKKLKVPLFDQARRAWIFSHGAKTRYPFQANLFGLPIPLVKKCLLSFIHTYCRRQGQPDPTCANYEEWIREAFGNGIADTFMIPYSEKFWTVHPRELTTEWLGERIPMPDIEDVVEGALTSSDKGFGPNVTFKYPREGGIAALPRAFAGSGIDVRCSHKAVAIDTKNKQVTFANGTRCRYKVLISTIPLPELVTLTESPAAIGEQAARLRHNSILCVNIGVKREHINPEHWIYYPEREFSFFRISFPHNFSSSLVPAGRSSICAEIAYSANAPVDKGTIGEQVVEELIAADIIKKNDPIDLIDCRDVPYGYVIFDKDRPRAVDTLKEHFAALDIISAGRYGSWEYQWMDDAILDGQKAAALAAQRLR